MLDLEMLAATRAVLRGSCKPGGSGVQVQSLIHTRLFVPVLWDISLGNQYILLPRPQPEPHIFKDKALPLSNNPQPYMSHTQTKLIFPWKQKITLLVILFQKIWIILWGVC